MIPFDFSPLYRSAVGFDRVARMAEAARRPDAANGFPPFDILSVGEDGYRVVLAVAGFAENDLAVEVKDNTLTVSGTVSGTRKGAGDETTYLHRGIDGGGFTRRFELAESVRVTGAGLADGLLTIELVREVAEAKKPRTIAIRTPATPPDRKAA